MTLYRNFSTKEAIDLEYNATLKVENFQLYLEQDAIENTATCQALKSYLDQSYGAAKDETVDVFPSKKPDSPIVVFMHGGYWKSLSSKDFHFVAKGLVSNGFTVVLPNYSLCPNVSIPDITRQNSAAIAWLYKESHRFNGDKNNIFVCGHSAGGQQAAMLTLTQWEKEYQLPSNIIKGCIPISGLFDLAPLSFSWLQPSIKLTPQVIVNQSPISQIPVYSPPMLVAVGEDETVEFNRQSEDYVKALVNNGLNAQLSVQPHKNHFSIIQDLSKKESALSQQIVGFIKKYLHE